MAVKFFFHYSAVGASSYHEVMRPILLQPSLLNQSDHMTFVLITSPDWFVMIWIVGLCNSGRRLVEWKIRTLQKKLIHNIGGNGGVKNKDTIVVCCPSQSLFSVAASQTGGYLTLNHSMLPPLEHHHSITSSFATLLFWSVFEQCRAYLCFKGASVWFLCMERSHHHCFLVRIRHPKGSLSALPRWRDPL